MKIVSTSDFPLYIWIQTDARSDFSPVSSSLSGDMELSAGGMEDRLYRNIIEECGQISSVEEIRLYVMNKSLLDEDLARKFNYAKEINPRVHLYIMANGIGLSRGEKEAALKYWRGMGAKKLKFITSPSGPAGDYDHQSEIKRESISGCRPHWADETAPILLNGDLLLCPRDRQGEVILGNLKKQTISEIWSGENRKKTIKMVRGEIRSPQSFICKRCEESISSSIPALYRKMPGGREPESLLVLPIYLGLGCSRQCRYCARAGRDGSLQIKDAETVLKEIEDHLHHQNLEGFVITDPICNGNPSLLIELCRLLINSPSRINWRGEVAVDSDADPRQFQLLAESGCYQLNFHLASGSDTVLSAMNTGFTVRDAEQNLRWSREAGIDNQVYFQVGFPGEDDEEFRESVEFFKRNHRYIDRVIGLSPLYIQPGSDLERQRDGYGIYFPPTEPGKLWHDGGVNNYSFRRKRLKELVILFNALKIPFSGPGLLDVDKLTRKYGERILTRFGIALSSDRGKKRFSMRPLELKSASGTLSPFLWNNLDLGGVFHEEEAFIGPRVLEIELTNNCNLNCVGCWCHSFLLGKDRFLGEEKKIHLEGDLLKSLIFDAAEMGVKRIQLSGAGEPFLHPRIREIIGLIKSEGMECAVITNLTLLNEETIREMVELEVDHITASIWAGRAECYEKTHPGSRPEIFPRIKQTLLMINQLKKNKRSNKPELKIYNVISAENFDEIESMIDFALDTGVDDIEFQVIDIIPGKTDSLRLGEKEKEVLMDQFESLKKRPDYSLELLGEEHLKPLDEREHRREIIEFGRFYRRDLKKGFKLNPDGKKMICPRGLESVKRKIDFDCRCVIHEFDHKICRACPRSQYCYEMPHDLPGRVRFLNILGFGSFYRRISGQDLSPARYESTIIDTLPCYIGWTYSRITAEGKAIPCCKGHNIVLGNLHEKTFPKIWNSPRYYEFRRKALELSKTDPYFAAVDCYKSCDNIGMNLETHRRTLGLTIEERLSLESLKRVPRVASPPSQ